MNCKCITCTYVMEDPDLILENWKKLRYDGGWGMRKIGRNQGKERRG
jgi:hypothetical protein